MIAKLNPTGTHIHKGFLKVRIDLYPDVGDKTYSIHHVQMPVIPPEGYPGAVDNEGNPVDQNDFDNWIDSLPKVWQLNPALCAFIRVPETVIKDELEDFTHQLFNKDAVKTLDDILIKPDSAHWVSPFMRGKLVLSNQKMQTKDIADLIGSVNSRFADLVLPLESNGQIIDIKPQSVDIGAAAINRISNVIQNITYVTLDNPANATGTLDTIEIWANANLSGCRVGTFYLVSGTTYHCRDSATIGAVTSGSKQTFVAPGDFTAFDVVTGDFIGMYFTLGQMEMSSSGGSGYYIKAGEYIDPGDEASYIIKSGRAISLYGTGTETPTGWANKFNGVANAAIGKINGVAIANVKQVNGVA